MAGFDSNDSCGSVTSRNTLFIYRWLPVIRLSRVIALLLIVLVFGLFVTHHYLSKVVAVGNNPEAQQTRLLKLEVVEEPGLLKASDLRLRIEELMRIKTSVGNELRDLEKERQKYISEIGNYNQKVEELKVDVIKYQQQLERFKLSVEQAKYTQKEALRKSTPDLQPPQRILPGLDDFVELPPPSVIQSLRCKMHDCFDHSRCSLTSGFPVYYYNPDDGDRPSSLHLEKAIKVSVTDALSINPHITFDPNVACVFVVLLGSSASGYSRQSRDVVRSLERYLHSLAYWQGDGRNHVLLNLDRGPFSFLDGMRTGRAMVVQSSFDERNFRPGFDVVVPPLASSLFNLNTNLWMDLPPLSPAHRKFLVIFLGENEVLQNNSYGHSGSGVTGRKPSHVLLPRDADYNLDNTVSNVENRNQNESSLFRMEMNIVDILKKVQAGSDVTQDRFLFQFSCVEEKLCGRPLEWCICEGATKRSMLLGNATFSLIIAPANWSLVSTSLIQKLLFESLQNGAIPVVIGDHVHLAFGEYVDWKRAVVFLHKARVTELHFILRTFTENDVISMRHQGRLIWEMYMSSTRSVVDTLLATLRTRLQLPPLPAHQEPSPSVFNGTFVPLKLEALLPDIDPDERMGPTEPPYPSPSFQRNFTSVFVNTYETWNRWIDPFYSYPYTPFDPILPSDAKFLGSGVGFRPIGHGSGGSGKEFAEALGGNVPREQFTIVMLTYERESILINSLQRLYGVPFLNKVVVIWNSPRPPSEDLRWPDIGVPIHVVRSKKNSLNNRFLPYDAIETEAVLSLDDDAHLRHDEIMFGFRVWREARDRVVGFPGRYHAWDAKNSGWNYNANYTCELSMVLTGAAFFHKYYSYLYSYSMPQAIRDKVDEYMNCEDIAMNFLVSHITRKPPLKVTSRWTFRCPGCPVALSEDDTHFQERHKCINFFAQVYGYVPLLNTQFRVDSVLFKTRLPHGKQKCFKFI